MQTGNLCYWWYSKGWGGYVPAEILKIKGKKALISIRMKDGSTIQKNVTLAALKPR